MTRITTRLQTLSALAALSTITSLAIPAAAAWAQGSEPAPSTLAEAEQQAASAGREGATLSDRPSFIFPDVKYLQGLGWEIDSAGPGVRMEYLGDD